MAPRKVGLIIAVVLLVGLAAGFAVWHARRPDTEICQVCKRPMHADTRTTALVGKRTEHFCCPTCARTTHVQTGESVKVISLTDYETGKQLRPEDAYLVKGSDVNPCTQHHAMVDETMRAPETSFDRCSPSILAFATKDSAARFIAVHGGTVTLWRAL